MKYTKEQALKAFFDDYYHYKKNGTGPSSTAKELLKKEFPASSEKIINELELTLQMTEALKDIIERYPNSPWIIDRLKSLINEIES